MEKAAIKVLINKKISEHQLEVDGSEGMIQAMKKELKEGLAARGKDDQKAALKARNVRGMSTKITFHKAAIAVLNDLLEDIK